MKITDKKELRKLTSFIAMGDGSIHPNGGSKECVFSFSQVAEHEDFVLWVQGVLSNITRCNLSYVEREAPRRDIYKLQTVSHPYFTKMRDRMYYGKYKSIDHHALKLLDWEALAILYMCDGSLGESLDPSGSYRYTTTLNMCRLSYGDYLLLKKALKTNLDLEWNIVRTNRKYFTLRLRMKDFDKFMEGISPYIFDSFLYKVRLRTTSPSD